MRTTKTTTSLVLALLLALVMGLATVATAQDDSSGPDDDSSEDGVDDSGTEDPDDSGSDDDDDPDGSGSEDDDDPDDSGTESPDDSETEGPDDSRDVSSARVFGADRFATSVAISQYEFPSGAEEVYLARADNFADAVAAGALKRGPVLLVPQCGELPAVVAGEIDRLEPDAVVALGGEAAICDDMIAQAVEVARNGDSSGDDDGDDDDDDDGPATESTQVSDLAVGEEATYQADQAGTVTIRRTDGGVELVSATPAAGWQIRESDPADPGEAEVSFTDGTTRVDVEAEIEDAQVRVRIRVRPE